MEVFPSSARRELDGGRNPEAALAPLSFSFGSRSDKGLRLAEHSGSASGVVRSASEQPRLRPTGRQCEANLMVRSITQAAAQVQSITAAYSSRYLLWGFLCESERGFLTRSHGDQVSFHFSQMITSTEGLLLLRADHFSDTWSVFGTK